MFFKVGEKESRCAAVSCLWSIQSDGLFVFWPFFLSTGIGWNNWEFVVCTKFKSLLPHVIWPTQKLQSFAEGVSVFGSFSDELKTYVQAVVESVGDP